MCASKEKVYKKRSSLNRKARIKAFMKRAIMLAMALSIIVYLFTKRTVNQNKAISTNWLKIGIEIISDDNTTNQKFYKDVQFIVPRALRGQTDWHDYNAMKADALRHGHGEQGKQTFSKVAYKYRGQNLIKEYGLNAAVSDIISLNRSLPDTRKLRCREKLYLAQLPTVSIIIVCQHEYPSILKRALHSIVNRSPGMLLMEIIIVHTFNDRNFWRNLEKYAQLKFPGLIKFVYLNTPHNTVLAKIKGAELATAGVLVFLSPLSECNYNWLPPLLEPIAFNKRIVTLPVIDSISPQTFAYKANNDAYRRMGFDWDLNHEYLPLLLPHGVDKALPYKDIIMSSELFAIERNFFWELGGFDKGINSDADELFEFSFKTWMCGGLILTVPCSHVGVINLEFEANVQRTEENKKRIAKIWMDDYEKFVYSNSPELYQSIDAGDLSVQKKLRANLKCQSFEWFLKNVAPDILEINPPMHKPDLAWGFLRLALYPELCVDSMVYEGSTVTGLNLCNEDEQQPEFNQNWRFSWRGNLQLMHKNLCLEVFAPPPNATVYMVHCHYRGDGQAWMYDRQHKFLVHKKFDGSCLDVIQVGDNWKLVLNICDPDNVGMHWTFDNINDGAMTAYDEALANETLWSF